MTINRLTLQKYASAILSVGLGSGITFFSYPLLALLYDLNVFGAFGVVNAYALIISSVVALRFDYLLVACTDEEKKHSYLIAGLYSCFAFYVLAMFLSLFVAPVLFIESMYTTYLPALVFLYGMYNLLCFYCISMNKMKFLNLSKILRAAVIVFFQVLAFYILPTGNGLLVGTVLGLLVVVSVMFIKIAPTVRLKIKEVSLSRFEELNIAFTAFKDRWLDIKYQLPQVMINSVVNNVLIIVVEGIFGQMVAGAAVLAEKFVRMPIGLVVDTVRPILIADFSKVEPRKLIKRVKWILLLSFSLAIIYVSFFMFAMHIDWLDQFDYWLKIKFIAVEMAVFSIASLITVPILAFFFAVNKSSLLFKVEVWRLFVLLCLISIYLWSGGSSVALFYQVLAGGFVVVPLFTFLSYMFGKSATSKRVGNDY